MQGMRDRQLEATGASPFERVIGIRPGGVGFGFATGIRPQLRSDEPQLGRSSRAGEGERGAPSCSHRPERTRESGRGSSGSLLPKHRENRERAVKERERDREREGAGGSASSQTHEQKTESRAGASEEGTGSRAGAGVGVGRAE
ncbi:hypothetical protein KFK09_021530 [Dendrobium nobile]|uniref:Uncharacterized protein n=1 Tax=Dendrobium nobile TaxID=94219 RepID=A0A8T3API9_DENNO|nr:hypothetical protein KFK09_021530 [Dendrobium nobile]